MRTLTAAALLALAGSADAQHGQTSVDPDGNTPVHTFAPGTPISIGSPTLGTDRLVGQFISSGSTPEADSHSAAAFLPDANTVAVANRISKNITLFNSSTRALVRAIPLSGSPQSLAINPAGTRAVTANLFEGTASIVDLTAGAEILTLPAGPSPSLVKITPSGSRAVVLSGFTLGQTGDGLLTVINLATNTVERAVVVPQGVTGFSINFESQAWSFTSPEGAAPDDNTFIYPDFFNDAIKIINLNAGVVDTLAVADSPRGLATYASGTRAVISHSGTASQITIVDIPGRAVIGSQPVPAQPQGPIAVNGAGTLAAVAVLNATHIINLATGAASPSLTTFTANQMLTTADGNHALAVGFNGSLLSFTTQSLVANLNQFVSASVGAIAPSGTRAAMFSDTFGEDMVIVNTSPATPGLSSAGPTGPAPEGDKTRVVALNPAGTLAIAVHQFSESAQVYDTSNGALLTTIPIGRRGGSVAFSPDGTRAVITSRDTPRATVLNMGTLVPSQVTVASRGDQVRISPDGNFAYIAHVSPDVLTRINLGTLATTQVTTGNMGGFFQGYNSFSGFALNPAGTRAVTCNSADNTLSVIDTATMTVVQSLSANGTLPARAVFNAAGTRLYVTNVNTDTVAVFNTSVTPFTFLTSIAVADAPTELVHHPTNGRLYVLTTGTPVPTVTAIDTATNAVVATSPAPTGDSIDAIALSPDASTLYFVRSRGAYTFGSGDLEITESGTLASIPTTGAFIATDITPVGRLSSSIAAAGSVVAVSNLMSEGITLFRPAGCAADCDGSGTLSPSDFTCFLGRYRAGAPEADCDASGGLSPADFTCFLAKYRGGCP